VGIYTRPGSPFWWMRIERPGARALRTSTKIRADATDASEREKNRLLAERAYHTRLGDLARERYDIPAAEPERLTLAKWIAWYREHIVPTHRGAEREHEALRHWSDDLGRLQLGAVTRAVVNEWVTTRRAKARPPATKPPGPATVNREVDILKAALRSAVDHEKLDVSPIAGMKRLHAPTPNRRVMTREEEARLLRVLTVEDQALLLMALDTLCRLGDCLDLRWDHDHGDTLWIPSPKTGAGFAVPVTTRLRAALDAVKKRRGKGAAYVFALRRRPETDSQRRAGVSHMLRRACAKCDPPIPYGRSSGGMTFHWATRRTAATRMLMAGVPLPTVQKAGHWQTATMVLDIYAQTVDSALRKAVEGIGKPTRTAKPRAQPGHTRKKTTKKQAKKRR
jgi:integrase